MTTNFCVLYMDIKNNNATIKYNISKYILIIYQQLLLFMNNLKFYLFILWTICVLSYTNPHNVHALFKLTMSNSAVVNQSSTNFTDCSVFQKPLRTYRRRGILAETTQHEREQTNGWCFTGCRKYLWSKIDHSSEHKCLTVY